MSRRSRSSRRSRILSSSSSSVLIGSCEELGSWFLSGVFGDDASCLALVPPVSGRFIGVGRKLPGGTGVEVSPPSCVVVSSSSIHLILSILL